MIVTTGCFDIFHNGHRSLIKKMVSLGTISNKRLIIMMNSDESVARLKGVGRPVNTYLSRREAIKKEFPFISVLEFNHEEELASTYRSMRRVILVKGAEYAGSSTQGITGYDEIVSRGGVVVFVPREVEISTTSIINKAEHGI